MTESIYELKKIVFVTGTRADFGKLEPLIDILKNNRYQIYIFVTGMHMLREFGLTKLEVHRTKDVEIHEHLNQNRKSNVNDILVKTIIGFQDYVQLIEPDLVVVHGDRIEAVAAALVCANLNVRLAHIEGGEVSGTIDESYRHVVTKLSHIHFVSSKKAATRLIQLGESVERIWEIGSPELDTHNSADLPSYEETTRHYDIVFPEYGILIFHSVTTELENIEKQIATLTRAVIASEKNFIVIKPNNDPGSEVILKYFDKLDPQKFKIFPSVRFEYFSMLLRNAKIMIGNSSAGVREAPFLGVPSIDYGSRQKNRALASSVTSVEADISESDLTKMIENRWGQKYERDEAYGSGETKCNFLKIINSKEIWNLSLQKYFVDLDRK